MQWYLSNGDTFGSIQNVIISEVILYVICAFGTNRNVLIREVPHCISEVPLYVFHYFISIVFDDVVGQPIE
jgi:hypothetical protein